MIRITCRDEGLTKTVRIAGRLEESHLSGLEKTCKTSGETLTLDLSELQSADSACIRWLQARAEQGAVIIGASPYVRLLLDRAARPSRRPAGMAEQ